MAIFRSIEVANDLSLTLGAPIPPEVMNDMDPAGANKYRMKPGTYSRAKSITVLVDDSQLVQRMDFHYDEGTSYSELREEYVVQIGPPSKADDAKEQTTWRDDQTTFELYQRGEGSESRVGSTLQNLAS